MINVNSEIDILKKVIVHKPDPGIARITPKRAEELLFDDIVYLPKMVEEHKIFTDVISAFLGKDNVLEVEDLIREALEANPILTTRLIDDVGEYEELPKAFIDLLKTMKPSTLTKVLITGYLIEDDHIFFDPIPNFIFTRDIAVSVKDHIIITKAAKSARHRENLLTRFIFKAHPLFAKTDSSKIIDLNDLDVFPPSKKGESVSIEGGDMMVLSEDYLFIGASERTSSYGVQSLTNYLFKIGLIKNVVKINIPNDRSCMHIDTLFTMIDKDDIVCYKPIIYDGISSNVEVFRADGSIVRYDSVKSFVLKEINPNMNFIFSGDGQTPYQEREQWTDGCNLVALKPGVALSYDRNTKTAKAFKKAGYQIISAEDFLDKSKSSFNINEITKTIITLPSGELSRARGGSHCMTCPIERK